MTRAYLDHASTTPPRPEALAALAHLMTLPSADPGRLHEEGRIVRDALELARQQVAALLAVSPREVVFTSGGTEAINASGSASGWSSGHRIIPTRTAPLRAMVNHIQRPLLALILCADSNVESSNIASLGIGFRYSYFRHRGR